MPTYYSVAPVKSAAYKSTTYAAGSVPASYDLSLYPGFSQGGIVPHGDVSDYKLTIKLRLKLRQFTPAPLPLVQDANGKPFWTSPWTVADWQRFIAAATAQAELWNNKFWLQAPSTPTFFGPEYDKLVKERPNQAFRPNIRCSLDVDFDPPDFMAHRSIDIANLNMSVLAGGTATPGTFRSHSLLWDSLDGIPWAFPLGNGPGQPAMHPVIAHEIGHLIGLGHIGVILRTPLCELAQTLDKIGTGTGAFAGGTNSFVCYGPGQGAIVENIMGAGNVFSVENALPWLWSIATLFPKTVGFGWRAVMRDPGPGSWISLRN